MATRRTPGTTKPSVTGPAIWPKKPTDTFGSFPKTLARHWSPPLHFTLADAYSLEPHLARSIPPTVTSAPKFVSNSKSSATSASSISSPSATTPSAELFWSAAARRRFATPADDSQALLRTSLFLVSRFFWSAAARRRFATPADDSQALLRTSLFLVSRFFWSAAASTPLCHSCKRFPDTAS